MDDSEKSTETVEERRENLLKAAVDAHDHMVREVERLKEVRRAAFKRAVYSRITREELGSEVGLAPRTISHIINGK